MALIAETLQCSGVIDKGYVYVLDKRIINTGSMSLDLMEYSLLLPNILRLACAAEILQRGD